MSPVRLPSMTAPVLLVVALLSSLAACGSTGGGSVGGGKLDVVAGFYPLAWAVEQVGGDHVLVDDLTPPGAEPHDLELKPRQVAALTDADLAVHQAGVQPAVDDAIASSGTTAFDVAEAANLDRAAAPGEPGSGHADQHGHDAAGADPHFWLDPIRMADVADALATELGKVDPAHREAFAANAKALRSRLDELDGELRAGLADCDSRILATSHEAFGYFARRYDLTQRAIAGLSPDAEPTPAELAAITRFVRDHDVTTIFTETLVDPSTAKTVASETGARTAVLDPIEGLSDASAAQDYLGLMRANLRVLRTGLGCR